MASLSRKISGAILLLGLLLLPGLAGALEQDSEVDGLGSVTGRVVLGDGTPFPGGFVAFFKSENLDPMDYGSTRRSPAMIVFLAADGRFTTEKFPVGSYYLGAMNRARWRGGPPMSGEVRYSAIDQQGQYLIFSVIEKKTVDIGTVTLTKPLESKEIAKYFTIQGRLLDGKGNGMIGSVVTVKEDYNDSKALYISDPSAFGGYYRLVIPPGQYYLLARETVANSGRPKPDSKYGELGNIEPIGIGGKPAKPPTYIFGKSGQIFKNVDIVMFDLPKPEEKRQETEALVRADKLNKDSLPANLPLKRGNVEGGVQSRHQPEGGGGTPEKK